MNPTDPEHGTESPEAEEGTPPGALLPPEENIDAARMQTAMAGPQSFPPMEAAGVAAVGDSASPLVWKDLLYLLLFYFICGELLSLFVALGAVVLYHVPFSQMQDLSGPGASVAIVSQALLSAATLAFLYVIVRVRTGAPFWPAVGWRSFHQLVPRLATATRYVFLGFGLALAVSWVSRFVDNDKSLPIEDLFHNRQTVVMLMFLGIVVAPFIEETIFRGCLYPVIARRFGMPAGIVATGTLFGLAHAPQLWGGWGQIALLIAVGMVLTYIRARAGTVAASYLVHVSYNSILFVGLFFATGGLRHFPGT